VSAHIVVVHDDPAFRQPLAAALREAGHEVDAYDNSFQAWDALAEDRRVAALITRVRFPLNEPHGVALAHRARANHPGVLIVFTADPEMRTHTEGLGVFLSTPIGPSVVAQLADYILSSDAATVADTDHAGPRA
jgi:DNA-binding NtrC family response regulator